MEPRKLVPSSRYPWKLVVQTLILFVLNAGGMALLGYFIGDEEGGLRGAMLGVQIGVGLNLLWLIPALLLIWPYYRSLQYWVEGDEVIVNVGVVTKSVKHVPYRTVTNIKIARGPFDRLFNMGTLNIQTAGMSGKTGAEESLLGLEDIDAVYQDVAKALRRFRQAMPATGAGEEPQTTDEVLPRLLEEVRAIRQAVSPR